MKRHLLGVAAAVVGTVLISGAGFITAASAAAVPTTVTLPLFGAPLSFDITTDPGGAITDVAVTPADANTVATKLRPHKVVFQSANPADLTSTARIVIKSGHGEQSVSARAGSLADFTAATGGGWKGDVFGTGAASTVPFTIGDAGGGVPTITVGTVVPAAGLTDVVGTVQTSSGDGEEGDSGSSARVSVMFTNQAGDQSRKLTISVRVHTDEDGKTSAKLSISLGRMKGVASMAVGSHTWSGTLCNNDPASIPYTVAADGTLTLGTIAPAGATTSTDGNATTVTFATGEQVRIKVKMDDSGQVRIGVNERINCHSGVPTVNGVAVSIPPDTGGNHGGFGDHGHGKGGKNG